VTNAQARYTSALYNGELNLRRPCTDWLTLLAGFRMVELDEHYRADGAYGSFAPETASVATNTYNHLYGIQIGAEGEVYNMGGPLVISGLCKAGVYGNCARQNAHRAVGSLYDSLEANRDQASFLGEVGIAATYALTKRLAFRASYEAIWLTGVALAPEQIGSTDFRGGVATVNTDGGLFYHGGGLGFEYRF
jgi:hypothetical protein